MGKNKIVKNVPSLKASFECVLVCKKEKCRPFLEIFINEPENVEQQRLGILGGIFEITNDSEDSSYIANFLISVVKKEYYSKTKRGPMESFETALQKANSTLSKIAEHNSIDWIGHLNSALFVLEKNNIHFSQTGNTHIFLLRSDRLTDLAENSSAEISPNPLKTFTDVLSGRLEKNDRFIIATHGIFDIFSFEEIRKSALNFSFSKLHRFFKTAIGNELDRSAILMFDIEEKKTPDLIFPPLKVKKTISNAFSEEAFRKNSPLPSLTPSEDSQKRSADENVQEEEIKISDEIQEELEKNATEFIDKKTGHIYIKEEYLPEKNISFSKGFQYFQIFQRKIQESFYFLKEKKENIFQKLRHSKISLKKENPSSFSNEKNENVFDFGKKMIHSITEKNRFYFSEKIKLNVLSLWKKMLSFLKKNNDTKNKLLSFFRQKKSQEEKDYQEENKFSKTRKIIFNLFPHISRLKKLFLSFNQKQKFFAFLTIIVLFVAPYFLAKSKKPVAENPPVPAEKIIGIEKFLANDKNVFFLKDEDITNVFSQEKTSTSQTLINLNGKIFLINEEKIVDLESQKSFPFPQNFFSSKKASGMEDLNLIFVINEKNSLLSWSPITSQFKEEKISISEGAQVLSIQTYLTYLYLLDGKNRQIYRYPRANEGFGEKNNWLKEALEINPENFSNVQMIINENIFLSQKETLEKFFRGKKENFQIEETATPIKFNDIYSATDSQNIFVLDKDNSRIIKLNLEGNILRQYAHKNIKESIAFTIDEEKNKAYFTTENSVTSFEMK